MRVMVSTQSQQTLSLLFGRQREEGIHLGRELLERCHGWPVVNLQAGGVGGNRFGFEHGSPVSGSGCLMGEGFVAKRILSVNTSGWGLSACGLGKNPGISRTSFLALAWSKMARHNAKSRIPNPQPTRPNHHLPEDQFVQRALDEIAVAHAHFSEVRRCRYLQAVVDVVNDVRALQDDLRRLVA